MRKRTRPIVLASYSPIPVTMRIATIDVGTNTAQLLIADVVSPDHSRSASAGGAPTITRLHVAERFVRLGEGVDATGRIGKLALRRLRNALLEHRDAARDLNVDRFVVCATSASRDAANREAVVQFVRDETGLPYEILSGVEEATWSFAAACDPFDDLHGACLVVDVGGGSTELVAGTNPSGHAPHAERAITNRVSLDIGCIRLTERYVASYPPPRTAIRRMQDTIREALRNASVTGPSVTGPSVTGASATDGTPLVVIGTAGTASALALVDAGPESTIDPLGGDARELTADRVRHWREETLSRTVDEILELHPQAMKHRAAVFPAGVMILDEVLRQTGADRLRVSPYELRHGILLRHLAAQQAQT